MTRLLPVLIVILLVSGCSTPRAEGGESSKVITGTMGVYNNGEDDLDVGPIMTGDIENSVGIVAPGAGAVKGFIPFTVGAKLELNWMERCGSESGQEYLTEFNSNDLADVASRVSGIKFTYLGCQVWQLDVYEKLASQKFVNMEDDKTRLKSIRSAKSSPPLPISMEQVQTLIAQGADINTVDEKDARRTRHRCTSQFFKTARTS